VVNPVEARAGAWHQSTLETLLDGCSWQYYLQYVAQVESGEKDSTAVGTAVHAAFELHEGARLAGFTTPTVDSMVEYGIEQLGDMRSDDLDGKVSAAVRHWCLTPPKGEKLSHRDWLAQYEPVAVEPYFNVSLVDGALPVGGWIDGVYRDGDGSLFLIDHKTAGSFSRWGRDGDGHRRQAAMYATALLVSPDWPDVVELVPMTYLVVRTQAGKARTFEGARRVSVRPDWLDVQELGDRVRRAEDVVARRDFVRTPEWVLCDAKWCPYYQGCMVDKSLSTFVKVEDVFKLKEELR
jgi:hypothetical protein